MKISNSILFATLLTMTTSVFAEDFISANGIRVAVGDSLHTVKSKLGFPQQEQKFMVWKLGNAPCK